MKRNKGAGLADDLESEFDYASEAERNTKKKSKGDFWEKERPGEVPLPGRSQSKSVYDDEHSRVERQKQRLLTLDVYSRHKELINQYYLYYPGATSRLQRDTSKDRTDYDVLRDTHRFLWDEKELAAAAEKSWEARLAQRYYNKLFKEYCIADLSCYKKNRIALRWRVEAEVRSGKGQFECGNKRCAERDGLTSWEVNFGYIENGEKKNVLVKLRLCAECSTKLNFYNKRRRVEKERNARTKRKHERKLDDSCLGNDGEDGVCQTSSTVDTEQGGNEADKEVETEEAKKEAKLKEEAKKMMGIWSKPQEELDPAKIAEEDLDDFLDDMLL